MGTILYVIVPIPASDSHDRHYRHATVIAAGSSLFLLPSPVCLSARRLTAFPVQVSLLLSVLTLRFSGRILRCGVMNP